MDIIPEKSVVSPEDPDHVEQTQRFLRALTFEYQGETFRCDRSDLIECSVSLTSTVIAKDKS